VHIDLIPKINGGHVAIANLVKALANRGHEVHLIRGASKAINRNLEEVDGPHETMYFVHYLNRSKTILDLPQSFRSAVNKLVELDNKLHFDIIHAHTAGGFSITLSKRNDLLSKFIVTLHGNQLFRAMTLMSDVARFPKTLLKPSYVGNIITNFLGAIFYTGLETIASRKAVLTTVPSRFDKLLLVNMHIVSEEKIVVVPNCIDESYTSIQSKPKAKSNLEIASDHVILFSGPLIPLKGVHYLLKAMHYIVAELPTTKLVLAGEGMLREQACNYGKLVTNKNIICRGWVPHREMKQLYSAADVLAHPSLYESCSLTIAEALSLGVPVVAFNTAAIPEFVVNGETGLLAELGNSKDLASKITTILKDRGLAKKFSEHGKEFAKKTFYPKIVAQKMEEVYKLIN
jgi:glycosyltransferase involved in cell wall biosynthesis